jgi:hypothetical protein
MDTNRNLHIAQLLIARLRLRRRNHRRFDVRPPHRFDTNERFRTFWRYYGSDDEEDLRSYLRFQKTEFEFIYENIRARIRTRAPTHSFLPKYKFFGSFQINSVFKHQKFTKKWAARVKLLKKQ